MSRRATAWWFGRLLWLALAGAGSPAFAQDLSNDDLDARVGTRVLYDTDFFRVDNALENTAAVDPRGLDDTIFTAFLGLDSDWRFGSNQLLTINGEVNTNRHDKYTEADYTGGNALLRYDWQAGAATFGTLSYNFLVEPVNFENQDVPRIDFRFRQRVDADIHRRLTPRWSVGAGGGLTHVEFDLIERPEVDRYNVFMSADYESRAGNEFSFAANYQERESNEGNNLGFEEYMIGPEVNWKVTPDVKLKGALRYQERNPADPTLTAFDGPTGNIALNWGLTDKVALEFEIARIVSSLGDQLSNFAIIDSQRLRIDWFVSHRLSYYVRADREDRDFELEPSLVPVPGLASRNDVLVSVRAGVRWDPRRRLHLEGYAGTGDRSSNRQFRDFRYEQYMLELSYSFL